MIYLDLSFQAIFGGHISGKRARGVKANPLFNDINSISTNDKKQNGFISDGTLDIEFYKNIPSSPVKRGDTAKQNGKVKDGNSIHERGSDLKTLMSSKSESLRESLKVTNGNVFVGDIIIENGYPPQYNGTHKHLNGDIKGIQPHMNGHLSKQHEDINDNYKNNISNGDLENVKTNNNSTSGGSMENSLDSKSPEEHENSDWPDLNDITIEVNEKIDFNENRIGENVFSANNSPQKYSNPEGHCNDSRTSCVNHVQSSDHQNGKIYITDEIDEVMLESIERVKIKKSKKIKERKNSVPENILNCVGEKRIKPILMSSMSMESHDLPPYERRISDDNGDHKSVTFSNDTVFNDHRPNKYKKEKSIVFKGNNSMTAKTNQSFINDDGIEGSLTDDQKAARSYAQVLGS